MRITDRNLPYSIKKKVRYFLNILRSNSIHLFLLSPPLSGSTAIAKLMETSPNVAVFPGNGEGQFLPEAKKELLIDQRWNPDLQVDWARVKQIFLSYWSSSKLIRFDKTPPQLVRAVELEKVFSNSHFLVTIRNPYAQIEGLLRRKWPFSEYGPQTTAASSASAKTAAEFWVRVARLQKLNIEQLERTCFFSYEELTEAPNETIKKIIEFMPEIGSVNIQSELRAHNITGKPIKGFRNLNQEKIDNLSLKQIEEINDVLSQHIDLLHFFQYQLLETG